MKQASNTIDPTRHNCQVAFHPTYAPVQGRFQGHEAIAYMSGSHQVTEFQFSLVDGFTIVRWERSLDGREVWAEFVIRCGTNPRNVYMTLESDVVHCAARLSDRSSVRGVGSTPESRVENRATDDLCTVINWIRRNKNKLAKRLIKQRGEILKQNAALIGAGADEPELTELPESFDAGMASLEAAQHVARSNESPIKPVLSRCWEKEECLSRKGKRLVYSSTTRTIAAKHDRIARLRDMADRQRGRAAAPDCAPELCEQLLKWAEEGEDRANSLQFDLNKRMAAARAARKPRQAAVNLESVESAKTA